MLVYLIYFGICQLARKSLFKHKICCSWESEKDLQKHEEKQISLVGLLFIFICISTSFWFNIRLFR